MTDEEAILHARIQLLLMHSGLTRDARFRVATVVARFIFLPTRCIAWVQWKRRMARFKRAMRKAGYW